MYKHRFENDYAELADHRIIEALGRFGAHQYAGYSQDKVSQKAVVVMRETIRRPNAGVHFVAGGTQANLVGLGWLLSSIGAVIAADTGHINVYEAGAVEATGHKVCAVPSSDGKLEPQSLHELMEVHQQEELVTPEVIFLSQSTELGNIYRKSEIERIREFCNHWNLLLYIDGARIGSAITSDVSDFGMADIGELADAFFIGGTKNGALFGEALVMVNPELDRGFRSAIRQRGALLAKGYAVGAQFHELFRDGLYFGLAEHANTMARRLSEGLDTLGYTFWQDCETNQIFPLLSNQLIARIQNDYAFHIWEKYDEDHSIVRLVTSGATPSEKVDEFLVDLAEADT